MFENFQLSDLFEINCVCICAYLIIFITQDELSVNFADFIVAPFYFTLTKLLPKCTAICRCVVFISARWFLFDVTNLAFMWIKFRNCCVIWSLGHRIILNYDILKRKQSYTIDLLTFNIRHRELRNNRLTWHNMIVSRLKSDIQSAPELKTQAETALTSWENRWVWWCVLRVVMCVVSCVIFVVSCEINKIINFIVQTKYISHKFWFISMPLTVFCYILALLLYFNNNSTFLHPITQKCGLFEQVQRAHEPLRPRPQ